MTAAERIYQRCDELASCSESTDMLTRVYLSPEHRQANLLVGGWMREAGMQVWQDAVGNICGRYEGLQPGAPAWLLGSHLDTVRHAGRYDGMLGVLTAIELVDGLNRQGIRLPFALEVVGFGDEEGVRFGSTLLGSGGLAAGWPVECLEVKDADGMSIAEALVNFGLDPAQTHLAKRKRNQLLGYLELHIEQGPQLEAAQLPLGVVTAIHGAKRLNLTFTGEAGHAGTVPMTMRHDALAGASELILAIEHLAAASRSMPAGGVVATVGRLAVQPDAVNVIPGEVRFSLDIRSAEDSVRDQILEQILSRGQQIASQRGLQFVSDCFYVSKATPCHAQLQSLLAEAVEQVQGQSMMLSSGAGHDAVAMAALCPVGMMFVRCRKGISHHPDESVTVADIDAALQAMDLMVRQCLVRFREA